MPAVALPRCRRIAAALAVLLAPALLVRSPLAKDSEPPIQPRVPGAPASVLAPPDITGPGAVLRSGRLHVKVTNGGVIGNPYTNLSSDPSAQWPDESGVEHLSYIGLAVGAKDPAPPPGVPAHRVSYLTEWSPPTADALDRMYRTNEGATGGLPLVNDDADVDPVTGEPRVDEEFLDGRDNDGDGLVDEDFAALGYETFACVMRDDGAYSQPVLGEPHTPLGLECRQMAWAYPLPGLEDFVAVRYSIVNRSGHQLDSLYIGFAVDLDVGPTSTPAFYADDRDLPGYPSGEFVRLVEPSDLQYQWPHEPIPGVSPDSGLCPRVPLRVNGFSVADDDGDGGATPGVASFLLIDHTIDPLGEHAPARVGFRAFRSFPGGTPWGSGGNPTTDSLRYVFLSGTEHVDPATGFVDAAPGATAADYRAWCSVGPFLVVPNGAEVQVTVALAVRPGTVAAGLQYASDYAEWRNGSLPYAALVAAHPALENALTIQRVHDGVHEPTSSGLPVPDLHGRETPIRLPSGSPPILVADCRTELRLVTDQQTEWFDFDCDWCTGVWSQPLQVGAIPHRWKVDTSLLGVGQEGGRKGAGPISDLAVSPNPSRDVGRLSFTLARAGDVRIAVYDLAGRRVRLLAAGTRSAGRHEVAWDGRDARGRAAPPGLYLWKVQSGDDEAGARMVRIE